MGKRIIQQRRGRGTGAYRAPSFRFKDRPKHLPEPEGMLVGVVIDLIKCQAHTAPLAKVAYSNGETGMILAPEGLSVGQEVQAGQDADVTSGNALTLADMPEGTLVYNIESQPGDGGKFIRASGTFGRVLAKTPAGVVIKMPSKKQRVFNAKCRANIGVVAGGGRLEKPLLRAGTAYFKHKARNHLWPKVAGSAMNAVDHPFGNKRTSRKSKARPTSRNAPPGRKVGMVAARRTGRKKR